MLESKSCDPCNCFRGGSYATPCDSFSGQCKCKPGFYGRTCSDKDCVMNEWTEWAECPCGLPGITHRNKTVKTFSSGAGEICPKGVLTQTKRCPDQPCNCQGGYYGDLCQNLDCTLGPWSEWSSCYPCPYACQHLKNDDWCPPGTTAHDTMIRNRTVQIQKEGFGKCPGNLIDSIKCSNCVKICSPSKSEGHHLQGINTLTFINCYYMRGYTKV